MLAQELCTVEIAEIIVVASGCSDDTVPIVQAFACRDPRIRLIVQEKREGKTSAMNVFLQNASEQVCVWESADTVAGKGSIEALCKLFEDSQVGMTARKKSRSTWTSTLSGTCRTCACGWSTSSAWRSRARAN